MHSKLREEMELLLITELKSFFHTVFSHRECGRDLSRRQMDYQTDFLSCGVAAYAIEHCGDRAFDTQAFAELLWDCLQRTYGDI